MNFRKPDFVTFTGIDDATPIDGMEALAQRFPIEWGVLLDPDRQGKDERFPARETLASIAASGLRLAAHLCGSYTQAIRAGEIPQTPVQLGRFARLQINSDKVDVDQAARLAAATGRRCILPCGGDTFPDSDAVDWLHDLSGGRGLETRRWPRYPGRLAGYAGGMGPDGIETALDGIGAEGPYWIDMETRIRRDGRLDLERCERVCVAIFGP